MTQNEDQNVTIAIERKPSKTSLNVQTKVIEENDSNEIFDLQALMKKYFKVKNTLAREFLAETFGIFILIVFGCGSVAQHVFTPREDRNVLSINLAFGFGATLAGIITGKVSGCHINPAVSLAMLITGRLKFLQFIIYCIGQFIGAFLGAFFVWAVYFDAIQRFHNTAKSDQTIGIFGTYPSPDLSIFGGLLDQIFGTTLLIIFVLAITDKKNIELPNGTGPILVGLLIITIGTSFGVNCGYAINPARDFGPRLFTAIAGWGLKPFTNGNYFFWIPLVGPMLGSILGVLVYSAFISNHWT